MKFNKLVREYQGVILSIGILLASGLGILFGVIPLVQKIITLNTQFTSVSAEVAVLKNKVAVLESIDEASMKNNVQILLSAVPSDKSLSTLLGTIDGLTAKTGVAAGSFTLAKLGSLATESAKRVSADEQAVGGSILPFSLSISGTLDQVRGFLTASVSVRRLIRIRTVDVFFGKNTSESSSSARVASATLGMDAFYAPLLTTIGSVSQPLTLPTATDDEIVAKISGMQLLVNPSAPLPPPVYGPAKPDPFSL